MNVNGKPLPPPRDIAEARIRLQWARVPYGPPRDIAGATADLAALVDAELRAEGVGA